MEYCGKLFPFVHEIVGLFGNIRNILEISCKFLLNFECSISEIHEILRFLETKLCYIEATRLQLLLSW